MESSISVMKFLEETKKAASLIQKHIERDSFIRVTSHLDADGLAAAGILGKAFVRKDANYKIRIEKQIDNSVIEDAASEDADLYIFADFGSGYLDIINEKLSQYEIIILDHHPPHGSSPLNLIHVNPHIYNLDGNSEVSGAGVAYFTAKNIDDSNIDLSPLAIVGALGDRQDRGKKKNLLGLNEIIVQEGVENGHIETETDLLFYGRETRPIHKALAYTNDPYLSGLSSEEDRCLSFLLNLGIELRHKDRWRTLTDLTAEEKQKLFSEIAKLLSSKGIPNDVTFSLIGTVYTLIEEDRWTSLRNGREYASLLNACGRMNKAGLGVILCMGDRGEVINETLEVLDSYRKKIAEYLNWIYLNPDALEELKNIYVIRGGEVIDDKMIGVIASILLSSGFLDSKKPIIALSNSSNNMIKVSGRSITILKDKGMNIGEVFSEASEKFNGTGGGHDMAAGAQIPLDSQENFTEYVDLLVSRYQDSLK
jgi:RecJ-like exonuclease